MINFDSLLNLSISLFPGKMSTNEAKLKKLRFQRKRLLSDLKHTIAAAVQLSKVSAPLLIVCKDRTLERYWTEFQTNLASVISLLDDDTPSQEEFFTENQEIEDSYHQAKVHLDGILPNQDDDALTIDRTFIGDISTNGGGGAAPEPHKFHRSHLPEIKFEPFDGNYDNWNRFSQMFSKLVAKEKLDSIDRLYYLNQSLTGEPLQLIKHLPVTEDSYDNAWKLLTKTYEVRRHIVNSQFQLFFSMKKMKTENAADLRDMLRICLECESAFTALNIDAHTIGLMMVYYCALQMDAETSKQWETELRNHSNEPKLTELIEFLQSRCRLLSQIEKNATGSQATSSKSEPRVSKAVKSFLNQAGKEPSYKCQVCGSDHKTFLCPVLVNASVEDRLKTVADRKLCFNCLFPHRVNDCKSRFTCSKCKRRHHTLLHLEKSEPSSNSNSNAIAEPVATTSFSAHLRESNDTLLATACVPMYHENGKVTIVRALIDQGSTTNFISDKMSQYALYPRHSVHTTITTINHLKTGKVRSIVNVTVGSLYDSTYRFTFEALVMPKITNVAAISKTKTNDWQHITGLQLADPKYNESGNIDLLIGARTYSEIILAGLKKGNSNEPIAQLTKFGWVLSGACQSHINYSLAECNLSVEEESNLSKELQRFWALEEVAPRVLITNEDEICERKFVEGVSRASDGKIVTRLPFKVEPSSDDFLGDSYNPAFSRLMQLERRLSKDEKLYNMYRQVVNEYLELGHMRAATPEEIADPKGYFLPHHAVIKMSKTTSKVRVVFDASCKSSNGKSLNDQLMVGATIQDDLFSLVLRWRKGRIAYTGDIEKMYRQFWVHSDDVKYQRILWRDRPDEPVKQYILLTVTFGTASAPFQAIRSLHHIGNEIENSQPEIAAAIKKKFYVDDFMSSADVVEEAVAERAELTHALAEYGLNITKWKSNSQSFQTCIPSDQQENVLEIADGSCKALGILWKPRDDVFTFKLTLDEPKLPLTKRKIVSEVAKLFDPLGWLAPSILLAKMTIQGLWLESLEWDEPVSDLTQNHWLNLRKLLFQCDQIKIKRWVGLSREAKDCSIHGFSDASEKAYGAVVYLRVVHADDSITTHLLAAKSKISPLQKVSLPRLELCGALVLSRLIPKVVNAMELTNVPIHTYTDSTIVLHWLHDHPIKWQTFVANRVAEIQENLSTTRWRHVISQLNPADCVSRGLFIDELRESKLWWHGPEFLQWPEENWPTKQFIKGSNEKIPEQRKAVKTFHLQINEENPLLYRFSSITKLLKFTAYSLRWLNHNRTMQDTTSNGMLTPPEIGEALRWWIRIVQGECFPDEARKLRKDKAINSTSSIVSLSPFLDGQQIIRVGGRLHNANLSEDSKQPMLLPSQHRLTWLIVHDTHLRLMHAGCQTTLQGIRQQFWIIHGRRTVSTIINKCVRCFRYKKQAQQQMMGNIPKNRVRAAHPFQFTGVDFAGYFEVKQSDRRNAPYVKCYVCLFVCMVTKAIHLELAKDLSTQAFLDCYRCFVARRGIPSRIYSDRGTNFIGAANEMPNMLYDAQQQQTQLVINECLASRTEWNFIPAHSPHMGGLWESGVKAMKYHLARVLHQTKLTEHKFRVVITQIEACLNSRPICKLTEDPEDLEVLTPGHFLIGRALTTLPDPDVTSVPVNRLKMYQHAQRLSQDFWKQWHLDYLQSLQQRSKWTRKQNNVAVGHIVLLKEDNIPQARWLLGRVTNVTYGADQLVRVVEVRCKSAILSRSIHKLCLLPTDDNELVTISQSRNGGEHVGTATDQTNEACADEAKTE